MQIDESDEQDPNADDSIRETGQPDSNVTLQSGPHSLKHLSHSISTDEGIQINESDEQDSNAHPIRET
jgi:hypothetical protein